MSNTEERLDKARAENRRINGRLRHVTALQAVKLQKIVVEPECDRKREILTDHLEKINHATEMYVAMLETHTDQLPEM